MGLLAKGKRLLQLKRHDVGADTHVFLRQLYFDEVEKFREAGKTGEAGDVGSLRKLLCDVLCDDAGTPVYSDPAEISELPLAVFRELVDAALQWSGVTPPKPEKNE